MRLVYFLLTTKEAVGCVYTGWMSLEPSGKQEGEVCHTVAHVANLPKEALDTVTATQREPSSYIN